MDGAVQIIEQGADDCGGFKIRLRDPASIAHQLRIVPPHIAGSVINLPHFILQSDDKGDVSPDACAAKELIASALRFAVKHGIAQREIKSLLLAPDNRIIPAFEDLGAAIAVHISAEAKAAQDEAVAFYRQCCLRLGGESLQADFDGFVRDTIRHNDVSFGLTRDLDGAMYGQESDEFRFRILTSPDLLLHIFDFTPDDKLQVAITNRIYRGLMPFCGAISETDSLEYLRGFLFEDVDVSFAEGISGDDLRTVMGLLANHDELDAEALDLGINGPLAAQMEALIGKAALAGLIEATQTQMEVMGEDPHSALDGVLFQAILDCNARIHNEPDMELSSLSVGALAELLNGDPTHLQGLLQLASSEISDCLATAKRWEQVISLEGESDMGIYSANVLRILSDPTIEDQCNTQLQYQHDEMMNGEVEVLSACILLGEGTIEFIKAREHHFALIAALAACSQRRTEA